MNPLIQYLSNENFHECFTCIEKTMNLFLVKQTNDTLQLRCDKCLLNTYVLYDLSKIPQQELNDGR